MLTRRAHNHARGDLVTVRNADHAVEPVRGYDRFQAVCDDFAARERVAHADVAHGDAVVNPDRIELKRNHASGTNSFLDQLAKFLQVHVARDNVDVRVANGDKRFVEILVLYSCRTKQAAVRSAVKTFFNHVTSLSSQCETLLPTRESYLSYVLHYLINFY